jgi:hypothetical protein
MLNLFMKMRLYPIFFFALFNANSVLANALPKELLADIKAYCQYIQTKNEVKKNTLMSPEFIVRAQNTNNDYPYQNNIITALSKDLSDLGKAKQLKILVQQECAYYKLKQEGLLQSEFALSNAQKKALRYKLRFLNSAKSKLVTQQRLVEQKIIDQNDTLTSIYEVDSALHHIDEAEREIEINLALLQPTNIHTHALNMLIHELSIADKNRQATLNKLEKLSQWSLQVQAGAQHNGFNFNHHESAQPYGALSLRYNLGSLVNHKALETSLNDYGHWKSQEVNGIQKKLMRLGQSIIYLKIAEKKRLNNLRAKYNKYFVLAKKLSRLNSSKAQKFSQQIKIDQLLLEIEIKYLKYFIQQLEGLI